MTPVDLSLAGFDRFAAWHALKLDSRSPTRVPGFDLDGEGGRIPRSKTTGA
jgi:hypothetical protein